MNTSFRAAALASLCGCALFFVGCGVTQSSYHSTTYSTGGGHRAATYALVLEFEDGEPTPGELEAVRVRFGEYFDKQGCVLVDETAGADFVVRVLLAREDPANPSEWAVVSSVTERNRWQGGIADDRYSELHPPVFMSRTYCGSYAGWPSDRFFGYPYFDDFGWAPLVGGIVIVAPRHPHRDRPGRPGRPPWVHRPAPHETDRHVAPGEPEHRRPRVKPGPRLDEDGHRRPPGTPPNHGGEHPHPRPPANVPALAPDQSRPPAWGVAPEAPPPHRRPDYRGSAPPNGDSGRPHRPAPGFPAAGREDRPPPRQPTVAPPPPAPRPEPTRPAVKPMPRVPPPEGPRERPGAGHDNPAARQAPSFRSSSPPPPPSPAPAPQRSAPEPSRQSDDQEAK